MTVTSQVNVVTAQGNGATPAFNYNFLIPDATDAEVIFTDVSGNQTTLTSTQYTITGIGNASGGTVIYPLSGPLIPSGTTLTIARILPLVQDTSISNQGAFYPAAVEGALDYEMMCIQQIQNETGRALVTPIVDMNPPGPLPAVAQRANQLLGFDSQGNPIAAQPGSAPISSVMQPVVNASTLEIARDELGLGAAAVENLGGPIIDDGSGNLTIANGGITPAMLGISPFTNLSSGTTTDLGTVVSHNVNVLGTNTITSFGSSASTNFPIYTVTFSGSLQITASASITLPGNSNLITQAGDSAVFIYLGSGNWELINYQQGSRAVTGTGFVSVRQTVLYGPASSGLPNFFPSSAVTLSLTSQNISTSTPLTVAAANGFNSAGPSNAIASVTSNLTWSSLTASSTVFLGLTVSGGVATPFSTTTAPIYQKGGTISVTNGQYTFDIVAMQMYLGNGSVANPVSAVFVGEAVTSGSAVTSTVAYAYQGAYDSGYIATIPAAGTQTPFNTNIGTSDVTVTATALVTTANNNYAVGDIIGDPFCSFAAGNFAAWLVGATRNTAWFTTGATTSMSIMNKTTGVGVAATLANFSYRLTAKRNW